MTTLRIAFDQTPDIKSFLESKYRCLEYTQYPSDIGFDLYLPTDVIVGPHETMFINMGIRAEYQSMETGEYLGYHLYPRSSMAKTKIRLANSVGIIDPNYRGYLTLAVDNISDTPQELKKGERYVQLVFVKMNKPNCIQIVDELSTTDRGANGFGSTGK